MEATVLRSHEEAHARALGFMGAGATQIPWHARGPTQNSWESAQSAQSADQQFVNNDFLADQINF